MRSVLPPLAQGPVSADAETGVPNDNKTGAIAAALNRP
jgi:hypothetical protein